MNDKLNKFGFKTPIKLRKVGSTANSHYIKHLLYI